MGFHKRYFSWERIESYAEHSTYESFETYLLNPDAYIFHDERSSRFIRQFGDSSKEDRIILFEQVKEKTWK